MSPSYFPHAIRIVWILEPLLLRVNIYLVFDGSLSALLEKSNSGRLVLVNNKKSLHLFSSPHQLAWELCNILYLNYTECAWHATYTWLSRWQTPVFPIQSRQSGSYLLRNNRENLYQQRFLDWYANCLLHFRWALIYVRESSWNWDPRETSHFDRIIFFIIHTCFHKLCKK